MESTFVCGSGYFFSSHFFPGELLSCEPQVCELLENKVGGTEKTVRWKCLTSKITEAPFIH